MYKTQWNHYTKEEATWKTESYLNKNFPGFLGSIQGTYFPHLVIYPNLGMRFLLRGVGCDTLDA
jgi:mannitol-specific phosphotransferase system IIBC component